MEIMMVIIKIRNTVRVIKKENPSVKAIPPNEDPPLVGHVITKQARAIKDPASEIKAMEAVFAFRLKTSISKTNNAVATRIICGQTAE
jgi:hypothetical protein